jgi:predicted RNA-binding protein with TRAM domain
MNRESVEAAFKIEPGMEGEFSWSPKGGSASDHLQFAPREPWATSTLYQVTIDSSASDTAGIKLSEPYQFSFTTAPVTIESTSPRHNDTQVSPHVRILIAFNTDMDATSVNSAFSMLDSELNDVTGDFHWSGLQRVEFRPASSLAAGETYTVTIDTTASDSRGAKLPEPYQFSFTTESIEISYTSPRHNDTQVSPLATIRITFNTDMDVESVNSAFSMLDSELNDVTGDFHWSGLQRVEFRPSSALAVNETYTVTIDITASGIRGERLPEPYQFSFTTAPITVSSTPRDHDTRVSPHIKIIIRFNTDMDTESATAAFTMVDSELKEVMGDIVWAGQSRMEFSPSSALTLDEEYTVTINTTAADIHGAKLSEPYQISFTTESIRISSDPPNNHAWVSPRATIRIWFNTDMETESVNSAFKMVDSELNEVTGNHAWRGPWGMDFLPHMALAVSERYTVTIDTSARTIGGAKLPEPYQFSFTTQPIIIVSTLPKNRETWVPKYTTIKIAFNTDMDMESVISAFEMIDSGQTESSGTFVPTDPAQVEFVPDSLLAPGEVYTVTISAGAADLYGRTLGTPYSFWFKTRSD